MITMTAQDVEISADAVADSGVCGDDIFRRGKIAPFKETAPKGKPKIDVDSKPLPSSGKPADKTLTISLAARCADDGLNYRRASERHNRFATHPAMEYDDADTRRHLHLQLATNPTRFGYTGPHFINYRTSHKRQGLGSCEELAPPERQVGRINNQRSIAPVLATAEKVSTNFLARAVSFERSTERAY